MTAEEWVTCYMKGCGRRRRDTDICLFQAFSAEAMAGSLGASGGPGQCVDAQDGGSRAQCSSEHTGALRSSVSCGTARAPRDPIHVRDDLRVEHVMRGTPILAVAAGQDLLVKRKIALAGAGIYLTPEEARRTAEALLVDAEEAE